MKKNWEIYWQLRKENWERDVEFGDEFSESNSESSNEEIVKKKKKTQTRKTIVVAKAITKPVMKKQQKGIIGYINS